MAVRPVERLSLVEQTTAELQRMLADGEWPVGSRVPGEVELGRQLGVGRSTVREAMRALISSGQLEARQGAGTFVASRTAVSEWERRLRRAAIADVYEVRIALEMEAARLAAARRTDADLAAMDAAMTARGAAGSTEEFVDADLRVHLAVIAAAHNPVLSDVFDSFVTPLRAALLDLSRDVDLRTADEHTDTTHAHHELVDAIRAGDADAAVLATRHNVEVTLAQLRRSEGPEGDR
ncbi:FadR/GntR family transcriptional regulator [Pseudonocardia sp. TRM90224]|uniref:FadR/GntR family transcriptional regulator n=1 Tax=Pseudonocardia sp. TRM90224 TaxID=2812678 RepID=UPI001E4BD977|nr:FCD domain-containing protein [Pseudonocardia sp. TRM90224]